MIVWDIVRNKIPELRGKNHGNPCEIRNGREKRITDSMDTC